MIAICTILLASIFTTDPTPYSLSIKVEPRIDDKSISISIANIQSESRVKVDISRVCENVDLGQCEPNPLLTLYVSTNEHGEFLDEHRKTLNEIKLGDLPDSVILQVTATATYHQRLIGTGSAVFSPTEEPCVLFKALLDAIRGGPCKVGTGIALRNHLGGESLGGLPDAEFEVRRLATSSRTINPAIVPGTRGATGVTWLGDDSLAVTIKRDQSSSSKEVITGKTGLFRIHQSDGRRTLLWEPESHTSYATAPLGLTDGRIVFVNQHLDRHATTPAELLIWPVEEPPIPLPVRVFRLLAVSTDQSRVFALALESFRPELLEINLENQFVRQLGFHQVFYLAVLRSPHTERVATGEREYVAAIAFDDPVGDTGWNIELTDRDGTFLRDLVYRDEHDLLPTWNPMRNEFAYLAEVD